MIDSHCHITDKQFARDLAAVIARAKVAGVDRMITIADTLQEAEKGILLTAQYPNIFCTAGVHPHAAKDWTVNHLGRLQDMLSRPNVVGVGEIGLDYHYDHSPRDVQREVFKAQLVIAKEAEMPVVVHCREAVEDVRAIVDEVKPEKLVIHCCTEKWADVQWFVAQGYLLSFTGIATYPKSDLIRETITACPLEQLMIETDAPYLAPEQYRGKRNEPAYVVDVAKVVAEQKGLSLEDIDRITTANTVAFFGLPT